MSAVGFAWILGEASRPYGFCFTVGLVQNPTVLGRMRASAPTRFVLQRLIVQIFTLARAGTETRPTDCVLFYHAS